MTDLIILNSAAVQSNHWSVYALTTVLVGGLITYRIYKTRKSEKQQKLQQPPSTDEQDVSEVLEEHPDEHSYKNGDYAGYFNKNILEQTEKAAGAAVSEAGVSENLAENVEKPLDAVVQARSILLKKRDFTRRFEGKPVSHSKFHESLDLEELVKIYRTLAYKHKLTDSESREYNIISAILASHSVYLTQKSYAFARP